MITLELLMNINNIRRDHCIDFIQFDIPLFKIESAVYLSKWENTLYY